MGYRLGTCKRNDAFLSHEWVGSSVTWTHAAIAHASSRELIHRTWVALWPLTGPPLVLLDKPTSAARLASLQTQHFRPALLDTFLNESVHAHVRFVAAGERLLIHKDTPHASSL